MHCILTIFNSVPSLPYLQTPAPYQPTLYPLFYFIIHGVQLNIALIQVYSEDQVEQKDKKTMQFKYILFPVWILASQFRFIYSTWNGCRGQEARKYHMRKRTRSLKWWRG